MDKKWNLSASSQLFLDSDFIASSTTDLPVANTTVVIASTTDDIVVELAYRVMAAESNEAAVIASTVVTAITTLVMEPTVEYSTRVLAALASASTDEATLSVPIITQSMTTRTTDVIMVAYSVTTVVREQAGTKYLTGLSCRWFHLVCYLSRKPNK
ncbi:hypothetical protein GWI33_022213 [Rhynchophorus ferrugineus]|uniref:Uncharacterized protein n=1 Tax=Rhynchophorus ferrugineus TaxID=354439 RepID=A0A834MJ86_RHYFE|nr:hypothetical protein GWI33_022213 [Rhynchophorus ferrugineus]